MNTGVSCNTLPKAFPRQDWKRGRSHSPMRSLKTSQFEDGKRRDTRQQQPKENITWQLD
jgi:hypothetical protein